MFFLTPYKLPFVWECLDHGECDHTVQLQHYCGKWHFVTVRVVCCDCYEQAAHSKNGMYAYTDLDISIDSWIEILTQIPEDLVSEN